MTTAESSDTKIAIGDKVVHPQHGVGFIAGLEEKQFEPDETRMYYVVSIPDTTLWVPVDLSTSGLRKLSLKSEIDGCRKVLQAHPKTLNAGRDMLANLSARIKQGTIISQCEVVRDLAAFSRHKPFFGPIADYQRMILNVLCQEWAAVSGVSQDEASHEIDMLLKKGRAAQKN
ncbi:MAG: CarD family transcriptional regulator [Anaerolineales bacterium]|jgi:RNA polymerase-interacting CarD/CdnL/TRCF family regulator